MAPRTSAFGQRPRGQFLGFGLTGVLVCVLAVLLPPAQAQAATFFRSASSAQNGTGSTSLTINKPAGVVAGDVMIATVGANGNTSVAVPSGWSATGLFNAASWASTGWRQVVFKVAGASEPASYAWALGSTRRAVGTIVDYIGVDNPAPIQTSASGTGTASPAVAPTITTTSANQRVISNVGGRNTSGAFTFTNPSGTTDRVEVYTSTTSPRVGNDVADFIQATAGATPTRSFTISPTTTAWAGTTIGLRPNTTGALAFDVAPDTPLLPTVALNGQAQTTNATMNNFTVSDTTGSNPSTGSGWNVTVVGDSGVGKSPVFKQYCSNGANPCGSDPANSYVSGGQTLPADSLKVNTTGASWATGGGSGTPSFQCGAGCSVDAASATKIVSATANNGRGAWATSGFSGTSLQLSTPTTMRVLPANELYRVDLVWSLNSGP
jgi:hypothetical protein